MTTAERQAKALTVLKECGLDFWVRTPVSEGEFLRVLEGRMCDFSTEYRRRFPNSDVPATPTAVFDLYGKRRDEVRAFLQAAVTTASPPLLVMVWRILFLAREIRKLDMRYTMKKSFHMKIVLGAPFDSAEPDEKEEYVSEDIFDARLMRHLGVLTADGKPVFDGFYALRLE